ncbi:YPL264C [Symbiodinium sp. CCMP2592]|nr:YPL264C [Symbiodinium sp. CCMP2592]
MIDNHLRMESMRSRVPRERCCTFGLKRRQFLRQSVEYCHGKPSSRHAPGAGDLTLKISFPPLPVVALLSSSELPTRFRHQRHLSSRRAELIWQALAEAAPRFVLVVKESEPLVTAHGCVNARRFRSYRVRPTLVGCQSHRQSDKKDYVVAGVANLRRSLERQLDHPRSERLDLLLEEAKKLSADLQPFVSLSNEFKSKWDSQKAAILFQKKTEIDAHLQREDDIAQAEFAKTAEVELRALATAEEQRGGTARSQELEAILRQAVETWRVEVHGASLVNKTDVEKAVRQCLARVVAWTSTQEQRMVATWKETARQLVLEVHKVDANSFQALEDTLSARRAIVDDLLTRQRRELTNAYRQMQDNLTHKTREMLQSDREVQRKRDSKADRRLILKEAQQAARSRAEVAKAESLKALDAHTQLCCSKVDRWASLFLLKKSLLQEVIGEIGPTLAANLDDELRTTVAQIRQRQSQRVGDAEDPRQLRGVASEDQLEDGERPTEASPEESAELEAMRRSRMSHELKDLKDEVEAMLAASRDRKSWKKDIDEAAAKGLILLQDAKAALEVQSQIFQKADGSQADDRWLKETVTGLSNCTQGFQADLVPKFEDVSNLKLMCIKKRHDYLGQPVQKLEQSLLDAEREILKSITRLAAEAEALSEIGRAIHQKTAALAPVASSWRKAATAALSIVQRLWQLAKTSPEEQKSFFTRLLAVLVSESAVGRGGKGFLRFEGEDELSRFRQRWEHSLSGIVPELAPWPRPGLATHIEYLCVSAEREGPDGPGQAGEGGERSTKAVLLTGLACSRLGLGFPQISLPEKRQIPVHVALGVMAEAEMPGIVQSLRMTASHPLAVDLQRWMASCADLAQVQLLSDTPTKAPALRIPQRAFSDGPIQPPREPGLTRKAHRCKEKERSWRRQSDLSVKSLSTYCPEDSAQKVLLVFRGRQRQPAFAENRAYNSDHSSQDRSGLAYDDLFAENRLMLIPDGFLN